MVLCFGLLNAEIMGMCSLAKHSGYFSYCHCHCAKYKTAEGPKVYVVSHSQRIQSVLAGRAEFTLLRARKQRKPESRTKWLSPFPSFVLSGALAKEKALLAFRVQFPPSLHPCLNRQNLSPR